MVRRNIIATLLIVVSLLLYYYSVFLPWVYEGIGYSAVGERLEAWFRSYDVVLRAVFSTDNGSLSQSFQVSFQPFWFSYYTRMGFAENIYIGWLGVFVFQILTLLFMALSLVKERLRDKTWHKYATLIFSSTSLLLSFYQHRIQIAYNRYVSSPVYFELGFCLALTSTIIFSIAIIYTHAKKSSTSMIVS